MKAEGLVNGTHHVSVVPAGSAREEHAGDTEKADMRPTHDQIYLAEKVNEHYEGGHRGLVTPGALQRWNACYGVGLVTGALRLLHGFPPEDEVRSPYAYVAAVLRNLDAA